MDRRFGLYIVVGLAVGAVFGAAFGEAIGNSVWGIVLGGSGGIFVGWFIAAAVRENSRGKNKTGSQ